MPRLFHVSDAGLLTTLTPRPSPAGTVHEGRSWVWAVDEAHLPNYLLPRQCPRVCWRAAGLSHRLLGSPADRVVAVEHRWAQRLLRADIAVLELAPAGFALIDEVAGYWVSEHDAAVVEAHRVADCFGALSEHDVELRLVASLWPYLDAVVEHAPQYSGIRLRNAGPRQG